MLCTIILFLSDINRCCADLPEMSARAYGSIQRQIDMYGWSYLQLDVSAFRWTWTEAEEILKEKPFFILSFVFLPEFVIRQVQTNIY